MSIFNLTEILETTVEYRRLIAATASQSSKVSIQVIDEAVPFLITKLWSDLKAPVLLICPTPELAERLKERVTGWAEGQITPLRFVETEALPFEKITTDTDTSRTRIEVLNQLSAMSNSPHILITSVAALAQTTIDLKSFQNTRQTLRVNDITSIDHMMERWIQFGYTFVPNVYVPGTASRRGGILDIYPSSSEAPYRIEFDDNQICSLRRFNPSTQRSQEQIESIEIMPAVETLPTVVDKSKVEKILTGLDLSNCSVSTSENFRQDMHSLLEGHYVENIDMYSGFFNHGNLLDYFPKNGLIIKYRPSDLNASAWDTEERIAELRSTKERRGDIPYRFPSNRLTWKTLERLLDGWDRQLNIMPWGADDLVHHNIHIMPFSSPPLHYGNLETIMSDAEEIRKNQGLFVAQTAHAKSLSEIFRANDVEHDLQINMEKCPAPGSSTLIQKPSHSIGDGFVLNNIGKRLMLMGDTEIYGVKKKRRTAQRRSAQREAFFGEIEPGDYVVHVEHGIAKFLGTGTPSEQDSEQEYMILQYAQGDRLYVPFDHLDRVAAYVAPMEKSPSLTRLGTQEWSRTKSRVEKSTKEMASELLSLYAERELAEGHAAAPDTKWQRELEASFPFEETPDQLTTLAEIKYDMESNRPMDRLVCGDVGYGKTEIALRAAFKSVMEGYQVAVLVPTTVLAQQHYETFKDRMKAYPTKLSVLSRFRSASEQKQILEKIKDGSIDICIGTHRLVQKDVNFKKLGLVIIDEEQRFGVAHKEKLKQMRKQVDVLTLTATPIPRTLHMSLAGVRDMSTIETAPDERLPIKTYVSEFNDDLIREAILRELDRQGQVYFLHNRIYNIEHMSERIRSLVPEARIGIAHGQMPEGELEKSMALFSSGQTDVLICTTIIESGLDIPNANTLIVNRADFFGLSQLYQLRGRIGRSSQRAYSYLLIPSARNVTEAAERRLKAMLSATGLGSGFKIAMKDLELRGAGSILGSEQSGHIHSVGFNLYTRILSEAVEELRFRETNGDTTNIKDSGSWSDVLIDLGIPSGLPKEYIPDLPTRLDIYHKLISTRTLDAAQLLESELIDRFGSLPWQVENLLFSLRLKITTIGSGIESIQRIGDKIILQFPYEIQSSRKIFEGILGEKWKIGNMQIRSTISQLGTDWEKTLYVVIKTLSDFKRDMEKRLDESALIQS